MDIRRVDRHVYHLKPRDRSGRERSGALLRIEFSHGALGYADCHPWIELGDLPLSQQLERLRNGVLTPLTRRSVEFARIDAQARTSGVSLFHGLRVPRSHAFLGPAASARPDQLPMLRELGFDRVKLKVHGKTSEPLDALASLRPELERTGIRLRLDFNQSFTAQASDAFLNELFARDLKPELIDWLEDPRQGSTAEWSELRTRWGIRLAQDRAEGPSTDVRVMKPAVQDPDPSDAAALCVTSYLDHPLGQSSAAWAAATLARSRELEACGLVSHEAYERNSFSECFGALSPVLQAPPGKGFGFDELLERTAWEPL